MVRPRRRGVAATTGHSVDEHRRTRRRHLALLGTRTVVLVAGGELAPPPKGSRISGSLRTEMGDHVWPRKADPGEWHVTPPRCRVLLGVPGEAVHCPRHVRSASTSARGVRCGRPGRGRPQRQGRRASPRTRCFDGRHVRRDPAPRPTTRPSPSALRTPTAAAVRVASVPTHATIAGPTKAASARQGHKRIVPVSRRLCTVCPARGRTPRSATAMTGDGEIDDVIGDARPTEGGPR